MIRSATKQLAALGFPASVLRHENFY
jgi:hypothetical protein